MPPSRRRPPPPTGQTPPVRRPRVAGLHNRSAARDTEPDTTSRTIPETAPDTASDRESVSGTLDIEDTDAPTEDPTTEADLDEDRVGPADIDDTADTDDTLSRRPAGKRRTTGTTRPADLTAAEERARPAGTRTTPVEADPRRRGATQFSMAVVLVVVAVVLVGLAIWFRGEADSLQSGDHNTALTDSATTSAALGQLKSAIEQTFSYNYTDLAVTQKAVDEALTGKARCEYDQLFGQVKELAPKQKIVMVTAVRDIALVRLDGDRAEALVFIDQSSTRVDKNNSVAGEAQFAVLARREGEHWKITEFNMFDQPLVNGQPAPKC